MLFESKDEMIKRFNELKRKINFYREHKENSFFDAFYNTDLDLMETTIEHYLQYYLNEYAKYDGKFCSLNITYIMKDCKVSEEKAIEALYKTDGNVYEARNLLTQVEQNYIPPQPVLQL